MEKALALLRVGLRLSYASGTVFREEGEGGRGGWPARLRRPRRRGVGLWEWELEGGSSH